MRRSAYGWLMWWRPGVAERADCGFALTDVRHLGHRQRAAIIHAVMPLTIARVALNMRSRRRARGSSALIIKATVTSASRIATGSEESAVHAALIAAMVSCHAPTHWTGCGWAPPFTLISPTLKEFGLNRL
jgi:hypothetical protein